MSRGSFDKEVGVVLRMNGRVRDIKLTMIGTRVDSAFAER
jgi:hypothetical protein